MNHAQEPWNYIWEGPTTPSAALFSVDSIQGELRTIILDKVHACEPNVERMVKCVNGCKGIQDPETTVPALLAFIRRYHGHLEYCEDQERKAYQILMSKIRKDDEA